MRTLKKKLAILLVVAAVASAIGAGIHWSSVSTADESTAFGIHWGR